ncbi:MAG TPA: hypothetical protein VF169_15335 [Albitalea sp.]|uniref:hypothetical protein n=1 Tax=Piscinibacter sp. TaxID=1903157 RepID=UPI002ED18E1A
MRIDDSGGGSSGSGIAGAVAKAVQVLAEQVRSAPTGALSRMGGSFGRSVPMVAPRFTQASYTGSATQGVTLTQWAQKMSVHDDDHGDPTPEQAVSDALAELKTAQEAKAEAKRRKDAADADVLQHPEDPAKQLAKIDADYDYKIACEREKLAQDKLKRAQDRKAKADGNPGDPHLDEQLHVDELEVEGDYATLSALEADKKAKHDEFVMKWREAHGGAVFPGAKSDPSTIEAAPMPQARQMLADDQAARARTADTAKKFRGEAAKAQNDLELKRAQDRVDHAQGPEELAAAKAYYAMVLAQNKLRSALAAAPAGGEDSDPAVIKARKELVDAADGYAHAEKAAADKSGDARRIADADRRLALVAAERELQEAQAALDRIDAEIDRRGPHKNLMDARDKAQRRLDQAKAKLMHGVVATRGTGAADVLGDGVLPADLTDPPKTGAYVTVGPGDSLWMIATAILDDAWRLANLRAADPVLDQQLRDDEANGHPASAQQKKQWVVDSLERINGGFDPHLQDGDPNTPRTAGQGRDPDLVFDGEVLKVGAYADDPDAPAGMPTDSPLSSLSDSDLDSQIAAGQKALENVPQAGDPEAAWRDYWVKVCQQNALNAEWQDRHRANADGSLHRIAGIDPFDPQADRSQGLTAAQWHDRAEWLRLGGDAQTLAAKADAQAKADADPNHPSAATLQARAAAQAALALYVQKTCEITATLAPDDKGNIKGVDPLTGDPIELTAAQWKSRADAFGLEATALQLEANDPPDPATGESKQPATRAARAAANAALAHERAVDARWYADHPGDGGTRAGLDPITGKKVTLTSQQWRDRAALCDAYADEESAKHLYFDAKARGVGGADLDALLRKWDEAYNGFDKLRLDTELKANADETAALQAIVDPLRKRVALGSPLSDDEKKTLSDTEIELGKLHDQKVQLDKAIAMRDAEIVRLAKGGGAFDPTDPLGTRGPGTHQDPYDPEHPMRIVEGTPGLSDSYSEPIDMDPTFGRDASDPLFTRIGPKTFKGDVDYKGHRYDDVIVDENEYGQIEVTYKDSNGTKFTVVKSDEEGALWKAGVTLLDAQAAAQKEAEYQGLGLTTMKPGETSISHMQAFLDQGKQIDAKYQPLAAEYEQLLRSLHSAVEHDDPAAAARIQAEIDRIKGEYEFWMKKHIALERWQEVDRLVRAGASDDAVAKARVAAMEAEEETQVLDPDPALTQQDRTRAQGRADAYAVMRIALEHPDSPIDKLKLTAQVTVDGFYRDFGMAPIDIKSDQHLLNVIAYCLYGPPEGKDSKGRDWSTLTADQLREDLASENSLYDRLHDGEKEQVRNIAKTIHERAGGGGHAPRVTVLRGLSVNDKGDVAPLTLFGVDGPKGKAADIVDVDGSHYANIKDYRDNNNTMDRHGAVSVLPVDPDVKPITHFAGKGSWIEHPMDARPVRGADGHIVLDFGDARHLSDWERWDEKYHLDAWIMAATIVVSIAALIPTGGASGALLATVLVARVALGAAMLYGAVTSAEEISNMAAHGQNWAWVPFKSTEATLAWVNLAASVLPMPQLLHGALKELAGAARTLSKLEREAILAQRALKAGGLTGEKLAAATARYNNAMRRLMPEGPGLQAAIADNLGGAFVQLTGKAAPWVGGTAFVLNTGHMIGSWDSMTAAEQRHACLMLVLNTVSMIPFHRVSNRLGEGGTRRRYESLGIDRRSFAQVRVDADGHAVWQGRARVPGALQADADAPLLQSFDPALYTGVRPEAEHGAVTVAAHATAGARDHAPVTDQWLAGRPGNEPPPGQRQAIAALDRRTPLDPYQEVVFNEKRIAKELAMLGKLLDALPASIDRATGRRQRLDGRPGKRAERRREALDKQLRELRKLQEAVPVRIEMLRERLAGMAQRDADLAEARAERDPLVVRREALQAELDELLAGQAGEPALAPVRARLEEVETALAALEKRIDTLSQPMGLEQLDVDPITLQLMALPPLPLESFADIHAHLYGYDHRAASFAEVHRAAWLYAEVQTVRGIRKAGVRSYLVGYVPSRLWSTRGIEHLLRMAPGSTRILFGSIPQHCGESHYSNANAAELSMDNAARMDDEMARQFKRLWVRYRRAAEGRRADADEAARYARWLARADMSATGVVKGVNPAEYLAHLLMRHGGVFKFVGEFTIIKEQVTAHLGDQAFAIDTELFHQLLDFCAEAGLGVLVHCDWGNPAVRASDGRLDPTRSAYENAQALKAVIERHRGTKIVLAHTGIGRLVRPDNAAFADAPGTEAPLDAATVGPGPVHIELMKEFAAASDNVYFDVSWNDVAEVLAGDPSLRDAVVDFIVQNPDRVLYGSDTVKPVNPAQYLQSLHTLAPLLAEVAARSPEAAWKLLRGNYETLMGRCEQKVLEWTRGGYAAQERWSDIDTLHEMRDVISGERGTMLAQARERFDRWLVELHASPWWSVREQLEPVRASLTPQAYADRFADLLRAHADVSGHAQGGWRPDHPVSVYQARQDGLAPASHQDVQTQPYGPGTAWGRRLPGATRVGATVLAAGGTFTVGTALALAFNPFHIGLLNNGAFVVRGLVNGARATYVDALRLVWERGFENARYTHHDLDRFVGRIVKLAAYYRIDPERLETVVMLAEQFRRNMVHVLGRAPIDEPGSLWTTEHRRFVAMEEFGRFQINVDRALGGLQASSMNGMDPRTRLGRITGVVVGATYALNLGATAAYFWHGAPIDVHGGMVALFGAATAALAATHLAGFASAWKGRNWAASSKVMRWTQAIGMSVLSAGSGVWAGDDVLQIFSPHVPVYGKVVHAGLALMDLVFMRYTFRQAGIDWRRVARMPMHGPDYVARTAKRTNAWLVTRVIGGAVATEPHVVAAGHWLVTQANHALLHWAQQIAQIGMPGGWHALLAAGGATAGMAVPPFLGRRARYELRVRSEVLGARSPDYGRQADGSRYPGTWGRVMDDGGLELMVEMELGGTPSGVSAQRARWRETMREVVELLGRRVAEHGEDPGPAGRAAFMRAWAGDREANLALVDAFAERLEIGMQARAELAGTPADVDGTPAPTYSVGAYHGGNDGRGRGWPVRDADGGTVAWIARGGDDLGVPFVDEQGARLPQDRVDALLRGGPLVPPGEPAPAARPFRASRIPLNEAGTLVLDMQAQGASVRAVDAAGDRVLSAQDVVALLAAGGDEAVQLLAATHQGMRVGKRQAHGLAVIDIEGEPNDAAPVWLVASGRKAPPGVLVGAPQHTSNGVTAMGRYLAKRAVTEESAVDRWMRRLPSPARSLLSRLHVWTPKRAHDRSFDAEKSLFEALHARLAERLQAGGGQRADVRGSVHVFVDLPVCGSCRSVALQFAHDFPNLEVTITHVPRPDDGDRHAVPRWRRLFKGAASPVAFHAGPAATVRAPYRPQRPADVDANGWTLPAHTLTPQTLRTTIANVHAAGGRLDGAVYAIDPGDAGRGPALWHDTLDAALLAAHDGDTIVAASRDGLRADGLVDAHLIATLRVRGDGAHARVRSTRMNPAYSGFLRVAWPDGYAPGDAPIGERGDFLNAAPGRSVLRLNLFSRRRVDLMLFAPGERLQDRHGLPVDEEFPIPEGMYAINMHGADGGRWAYGPDGRPLDGRQLAAIIRASAGYEGQPIFMLVCQAGEGRVQLAQELANALGVDVYAADADVIYRGRQQVDDPGLAFGSVSLNRGSNVHNVPSFSRYRPGLDIGLIREGGQVVFGPGVGLGRRPGRAPVSWPHRTVSDDGDVETTSGTAASGRRAPGGPTRVLLATLAAQGAAIADRAFGTDLTAGGVTLPHDAPFDDVTGGPELAFASQVRGTGTRAAYYSAKRGLERALALARAGDAAGAQAQIEAVAAARRRLGLSDEEVERQRARLEEQVKRFALAARRYLDGLGTAQIPPGVSGRYRIRMPSEANLKNHHLKPMRDMPDGLLLRAVPIDSDPAATAVRQAAARDAEAAYAELRGMVNDPDNLIHMKDVQKAFGSTMHMHTRLGRAFKYGALAFATNAGLAGAYRFATHPLRSTWASGLKAAGLSGEVVGNVPNIAIQWHYLRALIDAARYADPADTTKASDAQVQAYLDRRLGRMARLERGWGALEDRVLPGAVRARADAALVVDADAIATAQAAGKAAPLVNRTFARHVLARRRQAHERVEALMAAIDSGDPSQMRGAAQVESKKAARSMNTASDFMTLTTMYRYTAMGVLGVVSGQPLWLAAITAFHGVVSTGGWLRAQQGSGMIYGVRMAPRGLYDGNGLFGIGKRLGRGYNQALDAVPVALGEGAATRLNRLLDGVPLLRGLPRSSNLADDLKLQWSAEAAANRRRLRMLLTATAVPVLNLVYALWPDDSDDKKDGGKQPDSTSAPSWSPPVGPPLPPLPPGGFRPPPVDPQLPPVPLPIVVKVDDRRPAFASLFGIAQSNVDTLLTDPEEQAAEHAGGHAAVVDAALDKLFAINPDRHFRPELLDGRVSDEPGDPDFVRNGWLINVNAVRV